MVFEKIVGEILTRVMGDYLEGLNQNISVGLWSGELSLQNVKIKKQVLQKLGIPAEICFGSVQELKLKIPWKSLTSSKIQVHLNGLYLIANILPQSHWVIPTKEDNLEKRKADIQNYTQELIKSLLSRKNSKGKQNSSPGFTKSLILKIIDNLQITVSNIHIRVQSPKDYAFGITLESIKLSTVNKKGEDQYIDRTKQQNKNQPLRKKLHLKNLGIYWDTNSKNLCEKGALEKGVIASMNYMIHKGDQKPLDKKYIFFISSEVNLFQRQKGLQFEDPEYHLQINVQQFRIELENKQLQQSIELSQMVKQFTQKKRPKLSANLSVSSKTETKLLQQFRELFTNYYNTSHLQLDQNQKYNKIIMKLDTSQFLPIVKEVVKQAQKKKMLQQKSVKKSGWFSWSKQELTASEVDQIQSFLNDNLFTQEQESKVSRPKNYFFFRVDLTAAESEIAIGKTDNIIKRGISITTVNLRTSFMMRQEGYKAEFQMSDLCVDLFTQKGLNIIKTSVYNKSQYFKEEKYVEAKFESMPLDKPYIDAQLKVIIRSGVFVFNPLILSRVKQFTKVKVSEQTEQMAIQAYSTAKNKAAKSLEESIQNKKLKIINVDIQILAPVIIIPFQANSQKECWAFSMSSLKVLTDPKMLNPAIDKTAEQYRLQLNNVWMSYYKYKGQVLELALGKPAPEGSESIIQNFSLEVLLELEKKRDDISKPDVSLSVDIPKISLFLGSDRYRDLQNISHCFVQPKQANLVWEDPIEMIRSEKKQILDNSEKKGIIHKKSPHSQFWTRYIGVLAGNYLYLYANKNDIAYDSFVYIKNAKMVDEPKERAGRDCSVNIISKVSSELLSFQSKKTLEQWRQIIVSSKHQTQQFNDSQSSIEDLTQSKRKQPKAEKSNILYMKLNTLLKLRVGAVQASVYDFIPESPWLNASVEELNLSLKKYDYHTQIDISLGTLLLVDHLQQFKTPGLQYLLKPQNSDISKTLMAIKVTQTLAGDPRYKNINNHVQIEFGLLAFNWKPNSVNKLMKFFISKSQSPKEKRIVQDQMEIVSTIGSVTSMTSLDDSVLSQRISLKLQVKIQRILVNMVNKFNRVLQGNIDFQNLSICLQVLNSATNIKVNMKDLVINDYQNYPNTIVAEIQYFPNKFTVFKTKDEQGKGIIDIEVKSLSRVNEDGKDLLIHVTFHEIVIDLMFQPFLRTIFYVTDQVIPSLSTSNSSQIAPVSIEKPKAPTPTSLQLVVIAIDSAVLLKPSPQSQEALSLQIPKLVVKNSNIWREYTTNSEKVLVSLYSINVNDLSIMKDKSQLTNQFNLGVNLQFISSQNFYRQKYGDSLLGGSRIFISLSPIVLRLSNSHFKFIMKCINWNITYDDNCSNILYPPEKKPDIQPQKKQESVQKKPKSYPLYLNLSIKMLTLAVTDMVVPISNIALNLIELNIELPDDGMKLKLQVNNIIGSYFVFHDQKYIEKGMIGKLANYGQHTYQQLSDLKQLVRLFNKQDQFLNQKNDLTLIINQNQKQKKIDLNLQRGTLNLQLKHLLKISQLFSLEGLEEPPTPRFKQLIVKKKTTAELKGKATTINIHANDLIISTGDEEHQQIKILGQVHVCLVNKQDKTKAQAIQILKKDHQGQIPCGNFSVQINNLELFLTYKPKQGASRKRTLLNPVTITIEGSNSYTITSDGKLCIANKYEIRINSLIIEATISDSIRFQRIIDINKEIINEFNEINQKKKALEPFKPEVKAVQQILLPQTQKPLDKTLITRMDFGDTEILLINDANNMFVPIIKLSIHSIKPSSYIIPSKSQLLLTAVLAGSFFNPKNARWQPFLEKSTINLKSLSNKTQDNTQSIMQLMAEDPINFTLSSQFLISLLVSIQFAKKVKEMLKQKQHKNQPLLLEQNGLQLPSPYTVQNITNTQVKIVLTDNSLKKLRFDNRHQAKQYIQKHKQTVVPPKFKGYIFIPSEADEIDVVIRQKQYTVKLNRFLKHRIGDSNYFFACQVDKLTRVMKITAQTTITNCLEVPVLVQADNRAFKLMPGKRIPLQGVQIFTISRAMGFRSEKIVIKNLQLLNTIKCPETHQHLLLLNKSYDVNGLLYRPLFIRSPVKLINCLPKPLLFQFFEQNQDNPSRSVQSQEEYQLHSYPDFKTLQFKFYVPGFHWSKSISLKDNVNRQIDIVLRDVDLNFCVVKLLIFKNEKYHNLELNLYSPSYIINDSPFDLCFYVSPSSDNKKKQKHYKVIAGQKKVHRLQNLDDTILLLGADAGNELKLTDKKDDSSTISEPVGVVGMSEVQVQVVKEHQGQSQIFFVTLAMEISLRQMHKNSDILSKQVRFKAKYIIYNTTCRIHWKQVNTRQWFTLHTNERDIFYLIQKDDQPQIIIKTDTSSESAFIGVSVLGEIYFAVEEKGKPFYMKIDNRAANGHVIMQISEVKQQDLPYQLHNNLNSQIVVRMMGFDRDIHPGEKTSFVWSDPNDDKKLDLTIIQNNNPLYSIEVHPDEVTYVHELQIMRQEKQVKLKVFVRVEKDKRVVCIDQQEDIFEKQVKLSTTKVLLKEFGISIVMNHEGISQAYEAFFISMKYIQFFYQKTNYYDIMQFRLRFLQIDQNHPQLIQHPVMLTPQRFNYFSNAGNDYLLNILVKKDVRLQKQTIIKEIIVDIKDLAVRISEESIQMILGLRAQVVNIMDPKKDQFKIERKKEEWRSQLVATENHKVYIEHITISPLIIKLTASTKFGTSAEKLNRQQQLMGRFFTAFGVAFANIQESPLFFKGINLQNIFDTPSGIQEKLAIHYKSTALSEIYKVFGSLTVLGDPRGLFLNISTGLKDMVSKPVEGLVRGPLQLGKGLASGATSLYTNVMGGVLGSATKIIRSLSTGLNILTFDQRYIHDNLILQSRRTQNFSNGMRKGCRILFFALKDAVLGIVVKPIRGIQKQGFLGFIIGGMTAVAGIVIKPITGILDFIWISLDSIKNTIVFQQDSANQFRIRQPRVFYGLNSIIHQYSQIDANSLLLLREKNLLQNQLIIQVFSLTEDIALVILTNKIMILNPKKSKVQWQINLKDVGSIVKTHRGIQIKSKVRGNQKLNSFLIQTSGIHREQKEDIRQAIDRAVQQSRQE